MARVVSQLSQHTLASDPSVGTSSTVGKEVVLLIVMAGSPDSGLGLCCTMCVQNGCEGVFSLFASDHPEVYAWYSVSVKFLNKSRCSLFSILEYTDLEWCSAAMATFCVVSKWRRYLRSVALHTHHREMGYPDSTPRYTCTCC